MQWPPSEAAEGAAFLNSNARLVCQPGDKVDFAAFKALYQKLQASAPAANVDEDLKAAFAAMDGAKRGKVTKVMVLHFLTSVGDKFSDAEADAMLKDAPAELDLAAFRVVILGK